MEKPEKRLAKAQVVRSTPYSTNYTNPIFTKEGNILNNPFGWHMNIMPNYSTYTHSKENYHELIKTCRWFYRYNPIAGTVIERMVDMSITTLQNRRKSKLNLDAVDDVTMAYYDYIAKKLKPLLKLIALEYLVHGMAIPSYTLDRLRGNLLVEKLGRKRYIFPKDVWVRNPEHIILKRRPIGMDRQVYLRIPQETIDFIQSKGKRMDGTDDVEGYEELVRLNPEYVSAVNRGVFIFPLDAKPIFRKINSYDIYPAPFLTKALSSLHFKEHMKEMDRTIVGRVIEAIRLIKIGSDDHPAEDDDIAAGKALLETNQHTGDFIYNLVTPHTYDISWVIPPLDALLNEQKYSEANADIFLGLGFPRVLTTGETLRSNSSDSKIAALGPKATLDDMRGGILEWLEALYVVLAEENGFTRIPEPYFSPIAANDYTALVQFAVAALEAKAISKDTVAQLYGTSFETEAAQIEAEEEIMPTPEPVQTNNNNTTQQVTKPKE